MFDRPPGDGDALPSDLLQRSGSMRHGLDPSSVRLVAATAGIRHYVARGLEVDDLFEFTIDSGGRSASHGPRSTIRSHGARVGWTSTNGRRFAHGVVPDSVLAVRVGAVEAVLGENGFIAVGTAPGDVVVLTTADGERGVDLPSFRPRAPDPNASTPDKPGYSGMVEYAQSGRTHLEIDDLDDPSWRAKPSTFLRSANRPDVWTVGVVLLEGHRTGEWAFADLVVQRDKTASVTGVEFRGTTAFGRPDWPGFEDVEARPEPPAPLGDAIDSIIDGMAPLVPPPDHEDEPPSAAGSD